MKTESPITDTIHSNRQPASLLFNRRKFLAGMGAGLGMMVLPSGLMGKNAPSNHLRIAVIGCGSRAKSLILNPNAGIIREKDARVVVACDCFADRREKMAEELNKFYGSEVCETALDYREVLARPDIDGVVIATTDHWHVPVAYAAAMAGKDVYVEKPLTPALKWAFKLRQAAKKNNVVVQYGTQQRGLQPQFRKACEFVRSGYIGKVKEVICWCPDMASEIRMLNVQPYGSIDEAPIPEGFDYDRWIGPAPMKPYTVDRCTRFGGYHIYDYSLGFISGWGSHPVDIAQWGLGMDHTSPVRYEGTGLLPIKGRLWDSLESFNAKCEYANGVRLELMGWRAAAMEFDRRKFKVRNSHGTHFIGEDGWIQVDRTAMIASDRRLQAKDMRVSETEVRLKDTETHMQDFIQCMKTREQPISPLESAIRSDAISHLSDVAIRLGRPVKWDAQNEKVVGDEEADAMLDRPLRDKWSHVFNA